MSDKFVQGNWLLPNEINANKQSKYSLDFNGSDYIVIDDDPLKNGATNFTLSAWVKADGTVGSVDRSFLQNWNGGSAPVTFLIRYKDDGNFQLYLNGAVKRIDVALSSLGLVNNNWNHIVLVNEYDNSKIKVYVNGTLKHTETSVQVAYPSNSTPLGIGGNYNYWDGQIDEVSVFARDLSFGEVNSLWNSGTPGNPFDLSGDPVAYYKLGETAIFQNTGNEGNIFQIPNHAQTQLAWQGLPKLAWDGGKGGNGQNLGTVHTISFWINNNFQSNSSYKTASWFAFRRYTGSVQTSGSGSIQDRGIIYGNNWSNTNNNMPASGNYITYRTGSNSSTDNMQFPLGSIDLLNNESYNIIFVRDGGSVKCFINGQEIENPVGSINASFELLYNYISNTSFYGIQLGWEGVMTNLAIWKSDKESEVANIYNNGEPQPDYISTPDIWYKFDNTTTSYPSQYKRSINSSLSSESYVKSYLQQPYYNGAGGTAYHTYSILDSDLNLGTSYSFSFWMGFRTDRENFFGYYNKQNVYYLGTTPGNSNTSGILEQDAFSQSGNSGGGVYGLKFTLYDSNGNTTGHMNFLNSGTPSWNDAYDGELHNYIFVKDGQTVSFYFDNQLVAQNSMPGELSNTILHNINGTNGGNTLARTNMTTSADWGFFANKVLTASEISTIYNNGEPGDISSTSPTIWYSYDNIDVVSEKLIDKGSEGTNASILKRSGATMGLGGVVNGSNIKYRDGIQSTGNASLTSTDLGLYSPLYSQFSTFFPGGSYIETGFKIPSSYTKYSYSLWFKTTNTSTGYAALVGSTTSGNNVDCRGVLYLHNTNLGVLTGDGTDDFLGTFDVSSLLLDSNWHHIAATFIEGEIKVFIDGSLEQTFTSSDIKIAESTTNSFIGSMGLFWKLTNSFINEVAIFDRQLSNNEITSIYNNGKPTSLASHSPDQWWRLGDTGYATTTSPTSTLTYPNEISGKSDGITNASMQPSINADAPKVVAPGYSSGLVQLDKKGDAPNSTGNSISYNILKTNQSVYTPKYVSQYTVDNNYSMAFDGTGYISLGSSINIGKENTIAFWMYKTGTHTVITGEDSNGNDYNIYISSTQGTYYRVGGAAFWNYNISNDTWKHIAITRNQTALKLYVDGDFIGLNSGGSITNSLDTKFDTIGDKSNGSHDGGPAPFMGKLDEFAAWDKELTADQIKFDIYKASTTANKSADFINNPNLPNPVVWYRMGD